MSSPTPHSLSAMLGQFEEDRRHFKDILKLIQSFGSKMDGYRAEMDKMTRQHDGIVQHLTGQHAAALAEMNAWRKDRDEAWQAREAALTAVVADAQAAENEMRAAIDTMSQASETLRQDARTWVDENGAQTAAMLDQRQKQLSEGLAHFWQERAAIIDDLQKASGTMRERMAGNEGQLTGLQGKQREMQQALADLAAAAAQSDRETKESADEQRILVAALQTTVKRLQVLSLVALAVAILGVFR